MHENWQENRIRKSKKEQKEQKKEKELLKKTKLA